MTNKKKFGAGEGIRTLDPDLGNGEEPDISEYYQGALGFGA